LGVEAVVFRSTNRRRRQFINKAFDSHHRNSETATSLHLRSKLLLLTAETVNAHNLLFDALPKLLLRADPVLP
jgi:hypothetical protein